MKAQAPYLTILLLCGACFAQQILPSAPKAASLQVVTDIPFSRSTSKNNAVVPQTFNPDLNRQQQQDQAIRNEVERDLALQEKTMRDVKADIDEMNEEAKYHLPSFGGLSGTKFYRDAFNKLAALDPENYSIKDVNFTVENAFFDNKQDSAEFQSVIRQTGDFLRAKMKELKYDENNNLAKNYVLFQFFSETMKLKATGQQHFPFKYDFNDYMGQNDWSKMFVSKLIQTGSGQCHSLPMLYLILAEEIGAEAYLALSPNHSYIKFPDENKKWYNLELTNGMATTNTFILNSGFIKAEAIQSKIYMQNLTKKQLLSQFYTDLASGYQHKFGYDNFVEQTAKKALELYPENVSAHLLLANFERYRFEYVAKQFGVNPFQKEELQKLRRNFRAVAMLNETNAQYKKLDDLGFEPMPSEEYEKWLASLKNAKNKQDNDTFNKQFKGVLKQNAKN
ncbi:MAG: hypothetical protein PSV16_00625 [Flavobacterium sp.]|nr:hypothetical protein [Flavobacterium sp.]